MNKIQFLAGFSYNDKLFRLFLFKGRINCLCFDKDGNSYLNLNDSEKAAIIDVVSQLIIDEEKSYYVRDDVVNGRLYKIWCDSINKNYFWKSADGNDYIEDNKVLNMKYNHMPLVVYFRKEQTYEQKLDKKLRRYFKPWAIEGLDYIYDYEERIRMKEVYVRNGKKGRVKSFFVNGAICLAGIFMFSTLNNIYVTSMESMFGENWKDDYSVVAVWEDLFAKGEAYWGSMFENGTEESETLVTMPEETSIVIEIPETTNTVEETVASTEEVDGYQWELIQEAIEKNPNLTEDEKNFIYELRFVFDENHQYMDLEMVINRLSTLRITYSEGMCPEGVDIGGTYYPSGYKDETVDNMIVNYNATNFSDVDIMVFSHELMHVLQRPSGYPLTTELSNEVFTREVLRRLFSNGILKKFGFNVAMSTPGIYHFGSGYDPWIKLWYNFMELIPQKDLCKFQFQSDEIILARALSNDKYYGYDYQRAYQLIDLFNNSRYQLLMGYLPDEVNGRINEELEYFYDLRGTSMTKNPNCFANQLSFSVSFSESEAGLLLNRLGKIDYLEYGDYILLHTGAQMRSYFSNTFPETTIHLAFATRGANYNQGSDILKANGDNNKNYVIVVNEEFVIALENYISDGVDRGR